MQRTDYGTQVHRIKVCRHRDARAADLDEQHAYEHNVYGPAFILLATTGARLSEVLGAQHGDFDLEKGTWSIQRGLHEVKGAQKVEEPKSKSSRRTLFLTSGTRDALAPLFEARPEANADTFVFQSRAGKPPWRRSFKKQFLLIVKAAEIPLLPLKQFRHSAVTLLAENGAVAKVAQTMVGHSSPELTLGVYMQDTDVMRRQARNVMEAGLAGADSAPNAPEAPAGDEATAAPQSAAAKPDPEVIDGLGRQAAIWRKSLARRMASGRAQRPNVIVSRPQKRAPASTKKTGVRPAGRGAKPLKNT